MLGHDFNRRECRDAWGGLDGKGSDVKRIKIESLQPGDIILTARPGKGSKFIRGATGGMVSHAMICVQQGSFIDSTMDGVQARNIQREFFEDDENVFAFRLKTPLPTHVVTKVVDYARSQIGTRYSLPEAARSSVFNWSGTRTTARRKICALVRSWSSSFWRLRSCRKTRLRQWPVVPIRSQ